MSDERRPRDVDELLQALQTPPAPREAPAWDAEEVRNDEPVRLPATRTRWPWLAAPLAAAAAVLFAVIIAIQRDDAPDGVLLRGDAGAPPVTVELRLVVDENGRARRVDRGDRLVKGQRVFFRVSASAEATVWVWVDGPEGVQAIDEFLATTEPMDLRSEDGLIAYELEQSGRYVFAASTGGGRHCESPSCTQIPVEAH